MLRTGPTAAEQAAVREHFAYVQDLTAEYAVTFVGRHDDDERKYDGARSVSRGV
jgi:hypothetical protein